MIALDMQEKSDNEWKYCRFVVGGTGDEEDGHVEVNVADDVFWYWEV